MPTPDGGLFAPERNPRLTETPSSSAKDVAHLTESYKINRLNINTLCGQMETFMCVEKPPGSKQKYVYCIDFGQTIDERLKAQVSFM